MLGLSGAYAVCDNSFVTIALPEDILEYDDATNSKLVALQQTIRPDDNPILCRYSISSAE